MGKRSTKTTKTGKFMNPTDQWRKQCRRKELKKNKMQRQTVRDAVLKSKNPWELLEEIEEIEKMEIETGTVDEESPNEKGLKEKKRKLHDTLSRLIKYYDKEDPKKAADIKRMVVQSEGKRRDMTKVYTSYRAARSEIDVSDIPLPDSMGDPSVVATSEIPMPTDMDPDDEDLVPPGPPPGPPPDFPGGLIPPGPPTGPPPSLVPPSSSVSSRGSRAVRFSDKTSDDERDSSGSDDDDDDDSDEEEEDQEQESNKPIRDEEPMLMPPPGPPPGLPPPLFSHHTPTPLFAQMPPPPGLPPGVPAMPRQSKFSLHPPPIPPPPRPLIPPSKPTRGSPHIQSSPIISKGSSKGTVEQAATISAQPQLRNMQAEVTKFLPTTLRIRREQPKVVKSKPRPASSTVASGNKGEQRHSVPSGASAVKEDEYQIFMKQMQGLI